VYDQRENAFLIEVAAPRERAFDSSRLSRVAFVDQFSEIAAKSHARALSNHRDHRSLSEALPLFAYVKASLYKVQEQKVQRFRLIISIRDWLHSEWITLESENISFFFFFFSLLLFPFYVITITTAGMKTTRNFCV